MAKKKHESPAQGEAGSSRTAWFCVLERAYSAGDLELAHRAQLRLQDLGVEVTLRLTEAVRAQVQTDEARRGEATS